MDTAEARIDETSPFPDEVREVASAALELPDQARTLCVTTHEEFEAAGVFLRDIKARRKAIDEAFAPVVQAGLQAHRQALALKKRADAPCEEAETIVKRALADYSAAQAKLRQEAERKAAEERRQAEIAAAAQREQERREAEAEAERIRIAEAEAALDAGDDAKAERILETPAAPVVLPPPAPVVPAPVAAPPAPQAAGVSFREVYRWRIVNVAAINRAYLTVDEKKVNAIVRALGADAAQTVGGIEVYAEQVVAARA